MSQKAPLTENEKIALLCRTANTLGEVAHLAGVSIEELLPLVTSLAKEELKRLNSINGKEL